ncbi:tubulointerstitial nephritis antigen-like [Elysia marginata]|uniref:Tubulointerstitial nephritis antigen-like n=1 Tax=Elysia marginata TaxID=1093978 RepID=A0AAV4GPT6_9GAST|nr:tubulointerstitial nephritis antigen-like [Elysia marginata]
MRSDLASSETPRPRSTMLTRRHYRGIQVLLVLACCCLHTSNAFYVEWGPDLEGPWCATRPAGEDCCTGRDDECGVPILGTVCYCDVFCNDTAYDCCPDYFPHCHGYVEPTTTPRPTTLPPPRAVVALVVIVVVVAVVVVVVVVIVTVVVAVVVLVVVT